MASERSQRKLAVILHADVVDSTMLVLRDERIAHDRIQDTFRRLAETTEDYGGIAHEVRGDALLAAYDRASDAVAAALAFQAANIEHNNSLDDEIRPEVRVGISLGEVVAADGTLTGPDVVLAQRLEQLAAPGSVCISVEVQHALPRRLPFVYSDLGSQEIRGFDEPMRAYAVTLQSGEAIPSPEPPVRIKNAASPTTWRFAATIAIVLIAASLVVWWQRWTPDVETASVDNMAHPLPDKPSIAVLPFANMSGHPEQEYFADGMTDDLITDLSKISGLFVIARNSVFTYKDKPVMVGQVAEELGIRYVLEGSVRRTGDQVRINAQLIDAITGGHIWAERYDGTLENVFDLQDEVTRKIIAALSVNLSGEEQAHQARSETSSPQAYDAFLQGWEQYREGTPEGFEKSIAHLEQATKLDPHYSRAYGALAAVYWRIYSNLWFEQVLGDGYSFQAVEKAREYLVEAMKSPTALAYRVSAEISAHLDRNEEGFDALARAKSAVALDPNGPAGHLAMAMALLQLDRAQEAEPRVREAIRLDPIFPTSYLVLLARTEFALGRYSDAAATLELAVDRDAGNHRTYIHLVATYGHLGRQADAKTALSKANELRAEAGWGAYSLSSVDELAWIGDSTLFREGLRKAGVAPSSDWSRLIKTVSMGETTAPPSYEVEGATVIDVEQARILHDQDVPFIDVSKPWQEEHIPGAQFLMIWFTGGDTEFNEVRLARMAARNQPLVIYSSGLERRAVNACAQAVSWGFQHVHYFENGLQKWKAAGLTTAAGN